MKTLAVDRAERLVRVRLDRPEQGNALDEQTLDDLLAVLAEVEANDEIRVLVLSGAGPDFCLGGDRAEISDLAAADRTGRQVVRLGEKARRLCEALAGCGAVTIAQVHGKTIGAGLALAMFCDLRVGAETATFLLPELALGLPTTWGGALPRLISEAGAARVREWVLTARPFDASTAAQCSVLHRVVPEEELDATVQKLVAPLLRRDLQALRTTKLLLNAYTAPSRLGDLGSLDGRLLAAANLLR